MIANIQGSQDNSDELAIFLQRVAVLNHRISLKSVYLVMMICPEKPIT